MLLGAGLAAQNPRSDGGSEMHYPQFGTRLVSFSLFFFVASY